MEHGIYIGTSTETVQAIGKTILAILASGQEQETLRVALTTLRASTTIGDVAMGNVVVTNNESPKRVRRATE